MPLEKKDRKILGSMQRDYGAERGKSIYYATLQKHINEGKPINTPESKRLAAKRRHKRTRAHKRKHTRQRRR